MPTAYGWKFYDPRGPSHSKVWTNARNGEGEWLSSGQFDFFVNRTGRPRLEFRLTADQATVIAETGDYKEVARTDTPGTPEAFIAWAEMVIAMHGGGQ